jgi:ABC-type transport system substrate-binding protein
LITPRTKPGIKIVQGDRGYILYLAFNQKHPILSKPEVYQALKLLVDYEGIERDLVRVRQQVRDGAVRALRQPCVRTEIAYNAK